MMVELNSDIGSKIRFVRLNKKISQSELSIRTGLNKATLSRLESGKSIPNVQTLYLIADAMEIPVSELMGADTFMPKWLDQEKKDDSVIASINSYLKTLTVSEQNDILLLIKTFCQWRN